MGTFPAKEGSWEVLVAEIGMGNPTAAQETERAIEYFKPEVVLLVGVAGGIKDVNLGDVVAATKVYAYESGKVDDSDEGPIFLPRPELLHSGFRMEQRARAVTRSKDWSDRLENCNPGQMPQSFVGPIAAGEKVIASNRSAIYRFLRSNYGDSLAVAMEDYGFLRAAYANPGVDALVVRGISDLIAGKRDSDEAGWQEVAAKNASAFAFEVLANLGCKDGGSDGEIGRLVDVPELPQNFLPRARDFRKIKNLVLSEDKKTAGITGASRKVGVQGMGGIGKSVLAAAVARDDEVRQAFPDGVIWITLGQEPKLAQRQSDLAESLGYGKVVFNDVQQGRTRLSDLLANKSCLIILDDVWNSEHVEAFNRLGPDCRMLITTRNSDIITGLGAEEYCLDVLEDDEALKLLVDWSGQDEGFLPPEAHEVVEKCGNLPLTLAMIGAMVHNRQDRWGLALHRLQNADLDKIRRQFPNCSYPDLMGAVQVSVDALEPDVQSRYLDFAVFPEDTPIPEAVLETFWKPEGLDEYDTKEVLDLLVNRSLARRDRDGRLSLHDLQFDYLRKQVEDLTELHNRLLEAYRQKCRDGWHTGPDDGYFFQHLASHLIKAGRKDELRTLLLDFDWMKAKLGATDVPSLVADYDSLLPEDSDAFLVRDALRLSAHVIAGDKAQLAGQVLGRLMALSSLSIQAMLYHIRGGGDESWIRPLIPSLTPPGGPLLRTLKGHAGPVSAVAVTPDGRKAVSASYDQTLKVWDLERGEEVRTLKGHSGWVIAVAVTPDGRKAVSSSDDQTLKVWDLERGEEVRTLKGHSGWVIAVAVTPDGRKAVSASGDRTLKVWDLERGEEVRTLKGHSGWVYAVAVTPDGRKAVSSSGDQTLKVWDLERGEEVRTLKGHSGLVYAVAVTPDGRKAVSASGDRTLKVWDLERGEEVRTLKGHSGWVYAVAVTPDGRKAVSASNDQTLKVWDLERGEEVRTLKGHSGSVYAVAVTPDGRKAVSASDDQTLKVWDMETGKIVATFTADGSILCCAIAPYGKTIVAGESSGRVHFLRLENG